VIVGVALLGPTTHAEAELPRKGMLGINMARVPQGQGVLIEGVVPETSAETAGLRPGDILVALDGQAVRDIGDVMTRVAAIAVGQQIRVSLVRGGRPVEITVTMQERPRDRGDTFDVLYHEVVSRGVRLRTIVTKPHAPGRHPVLFLIPGMGPTRLDEPLTGSTRYSRILHEFAKSGFVTLRIEKPGIGDSEGGPYVDMDFDSELDINRQALLAVKRYDFVDPDQVFIFGHSMGGVFGPIVAAEIPVRGVAVYGTVAKTWFEYFLENTRRQAVLSGQDPVTIDASLRGLAIAVHGLLVDGKTANDLVRERPELRPVFDTLLPRGTIYSRPARFWSALIQKNLAASWRDTKTNVLAVYARNDYLSSEGDHRLIADIANRVRPGSGTFVALDGVDHGFQKTASPEDSFRRRDQPPDDFDPRVVATLKAWVDRVRSGR